MTLEFTTLLKPLVVMPIVGLLLLGTAILVDRLRRRQLPAR
jgi:hypothetical protein